MRAYCEEATKYGDQLMRPMEQARHVTVILNPVAKDRKSKAQFESYVKPILNCAGIRVSLVTTETEGQARELMEIMENTDAVVIAGGSGTIHEAVTGMLRRTDKKQFPIGLVPTGKKNITAFNIHGTNYSEVIANGRNVGMVKVLAEATMAVVRETLKEVDVLKVEAKGREKNVYALNEINLGLIRDTLMDADKYWYFGNRAKPYLALASRTLFKDWTSLAIPFDFEMKYTEPCTGCSKCYEKLELETWEPEPEKPIEQIKSKNTRWWSAFVPMTPKVPKQEIEEIKVPKTNYRELINDNCGVWHPFSNDKNVINMIVRNQLNEGHLKLIAHRPDHLSKGNFVTDGVNMFHGEQLETPDVLEAQRIQLKVSLPDKPTKVSTELELEDGSKRDENDETDKKAKNSWFSIDSENYEIESIDVTLLPRKLKVYSKVS